jgi:RND family efflux transporter MFP subunit
MRLLTLPILFMATAGQAAETPPVELTTRVSGVVSEVLVNADAKVRKGQVLLRLDPTVHRARVDEAKAEHTRFIEEEAEARRELERVQELYNRTVTSTTELDTARIRHIRAKAGLDGAKARLTIAEKNLSDTELKAPFNGVVTQRLAEPGVVVAADCQPKTLLMIRKADK